MYVLARQLTRVSLVVDASWEYSSTGEIPEPIAAHAVEGAHIVAVSGHKSAVTTHSSHSIASRIAHLSTAIGTKVP